jgi:serine protease
MAAPHVSGVAALLIANGVATTPDEVREILQSTAKDKGAAGWDPAYGWGIVDAYAALSYSVADNNLPVADTDGPYAGTEDIAVSFNGSHSYDSDGDTLSYMWDFGDGSGGAGVTPSHIYTAGGEYYVTLVVNDGKGNSEPDTTMAVITEVADPPVADAGSDKAASVGESVTFDGSGSYDIDDDINTYDWDFGDDSTGTGEVTTHAYTTAGIYTVTLTVTDKGGLTDTDTAIVTVTEASILVMHVDNIAMSTKTAGINVNAVATVTVVDAGGGPVAGAIVSGSWSGLTDDVDSGITNENGIVALNSDKLKKANGTFTFTVTDVVKSDWTYNSGDNIETSDSITVP